MSAREFVPEAETTIDQTELVRRCCEEKADMVPAFDPQTGASECTFVLPIIRQRDEEVGLLRDQLDKCRRLIDSAPEHIRETERELEEVAEDDSSGELHRHNLRTQIERAQRTVVALHQAIARGRDTLAEIRRRPQYPE